VGNENADQEAVQVSTTLGLSMAFSGQPQNPFLPSCTSSTGPSHSAAANAAVAATAVSATMKELLPSNLLRAPEVREALPVLLPDVTLPPNRPAALGLGDGEGDTPLGEGEGEAPLGAGDGEDRPPPTMPTGTVRLAGVGGKAIGRPVAPDGMGAAVLLAPATGAAPTPPTRVPAPRGRVALAARVALVPGPWALMTRGGQLVPPMVTTVEPWR